MTKLEMILGLWALFLGGMLVVSLVVARRHRKKDEARLARDKAQMDQLRNQYPTHPFFK